MNLSYYRWKRLFIFSLGLFIGAAFCMKWIEEDFWAKNEKFTMVGLELFYSAAKIENVLSALDDRVQTILRYHLYFDFAFMAGVYPGITSLCMMARQKVSSSTIKRILFLVAAMQLLAWSADIIENYCILQWIKVPVIGNEFGWYHLIVVVKWVIALAGVLLSVPLVLGKKTLKTT